MSDLQAILKNADDNLPASLAKLLEFLKIESISTDPQFAAQCTQAADFLVAELNGLGLQTQKYETDKHPMVVAKYHREGTPHLLFYGHYDVQPVDPLELWNHPPFEPYTDDEKIYGRGASDDKGQLFTFVEALRAYKNVVGDYPCSLTLLFEGEEECGSPSLQPFLDKHSDLITADIALVCDTNMWDKVTPAIATSLRGITTEEIKIKCASRDLHSGYYGGVAQNPIHVLANILAKLHNENGKVTLHNFYDGVPEISASTKQQWQNLNMSDEKFLAEVGLKKAFGEPQFSALEKVWARPTAEVNGISGGYTGEGIKTVIAAEASAKVSFRLVGRQDPEKIIESLHKHVAEHLPADCSVEYTSQNNKDKVHGTAIATSHDLPQLQKAAQALTDEWGVETALIGMGGSIPIATSFKELGMDCLFIGFGLANDNIHSPNEKYEISSFHKGIRSWVRILATSGSDFMVVDCSRQGEILS